MDAKETEFFKRLHATFRVEADEHIGVLASGILELAQTREPIRRAKLMETVFREAHSLKGAARSVNRKEIVSVCQPLEDVLAALKRDEIPLSPELCDLLHRAVDGIAQLASSTEGERTAADRSRASELIRQLANSSQGTSLPWKPEDLIRHVEAPPVEAPPEKEKPVLAETVRVPTAKLDPLLLQAEEMILVNMAAGQRVAELKEFNHLLLSWKTEAAKWKERQSAPGSVEWSGFLEGNEERLHALQKRVASVAAAARKDQHATRRLVDDHLEAMKQILMLPVASLVEVFPGFVRDLARAQGKEVDLVIRGGEIGIDKRVLEEVKDPLIHLVRNCVDHGMRTPEERARLGKPPRGTITLAFGAKNGRQVEIAVSDDGAGIAPDRVLAAAVKAGSVSPDAAGKLDRQGTLSLVFQSGVTTSPIITDISGRGLGLAIVREKVEKLGGVVSVESLPDAGTTFRLLLPMTLAIFRGVLVREQEQVFILPGINVERVLRVRPEEIRTVESRETLNLDGQILSTVRLGVALELPARRNGSSSFTVPGAPASNRIPVVVLAFADKRMAFQVDEVLDELQVLVKGLGKQLGRVRNIAGAAILGTGKVVPILNVSDLMISAVRTAPFARTATAETAQVKKENILVAEDSITSRTLIKSILETAGYRVTTAVDGEDAFDQVRTGEFDMVVSDVDMPRMSGFELTAKIRGDKRLGELPVVLVTALETREDRERGIESGANAYIVKSSFDQSNLLEVIRRLI